MKKYTISLTLRAIKGLENIPKKEAQKIAEKIDLLANDPRPRWNKKLKGHPGYRIAIGIYRVIYTVNENNKTITVLDIDNRKDIYKRL